MNGQFEYLIAFICYHLQQFWQWCVCSDVTLEERFYREKDRLSRTTKVRAQIFREQKPWLR